MQPQTSARDQLRAFVARIERLEEEKAALEAKRREEEAVLTTYLHALGMADAEAA